MLLSIKTGGEMHLPITCACLETPAKLRAVAQDLADLHADGHRIVVVVSAMGKTTDQLVEMD